MCLNLISVDWNGFLYDCDFNQQLNIKINAKAKHLKDLITGKISFTNEPIAVGNHCFGCTAGNGSSCGGALTSLEEHPL